MTRKEGLTCVGIIVMVFGVFLIALTTSSFYPVDFNAIILGVILCIAGFIIVAVYHSLSLSVGLAFLFFGLVRVTKTYFALPHISDPFLRIQASHFGEIGCLYIIFGSLLIIYSVAGKRKAKRAK